MNGSRKIHYMYGNTARKMNGVGVRREAAANTQKKYMQSSITQPDWKRRAGQTVVAEPHTKSYQRDKERKISKSRHSSYAKTRQKAQERMNPVSFVIFMIGMVAILLVFFNYIDTHSKTLDASRVLSRKESLLQKLKSENDAKEDSLNSKVELQKVYEIATTQYGMVHANENQIIVYKKNESEYIKQNEDIPTR